MLNLTFFCATALLGLIVLLWTLLPLAQHAIDRTVSFWLFWGMVELALVTFAIAVLRKKT
jgi:hypothetical protein